MIRKFWNTKEFSLMFIPCIIRRIKRQNQQYALIVSLLYFYVLAPTCFGSSLPSSGSLLDPPELLENTYTAHGTTTVRHTGHVTTRYMIYQPSVCIFKKLRRIQLAPWWWQATAKTCRNQHVKQKSGTIRAYCWFCLLIQNNLLTSCATIVLYRTPPK
jgi:hypothetical protein